VLRGHKRTPKQGTEVVTHFTRRTLKINGIDTVVLEAGSGPPLVYLHGAGTVTGFDFAEAWTRKFRVVIPYHPGFGASADDPAIEEIQDFVVHYAELFDTLELGQFRLVGQSMGGFIAAKFAVEHGPKIEKLVLVCPIGIPVPPSAPTVNFLAVPPEALPELLAHNPQTVIKHLPSGAPPPEFIAERVKEGTTAGRVLGGGNVTFDEHLPQQLQRLAMPTLLVWGKQDKLTPTAQHKAWAKALPNATVKLFDNAGHLVLDEAPAAVSAIADF
jgi:pimeloyl-ACP methyl ester carboxylesterase